jgi:hypothetical protein
MNPILTPASAGQALDRAVSRLVQEFTAPRLAPREACERGLIKLREARGQTLELIGDLTQEESDFFPATLLPSAKSWSIGQILQHLLLIESLHRKLIRDLIELGRQGAKKNLELTFTEIDNSIAFLPRSVMPMLAAPLNFLNMFIPRIVREEMFRVPIIPGTNPTAAEPVLTRPIAELRAEALSSLTMTAEIFQGHLPPDLLERTFSHPLLGAHNAADVLGILAAHEERHHGQIRRAFSDPHFPPRPKTAGIA